MLNEKMCKQIYGEPCYIDNVKVYTLYKEPLERLLKNKGVSLSDIRRDANNNFSLSDYAVQYSMPSGDVLIAFCGDISECGYIYNVSEPHLSDVSSINENDVRLTSSLLFSIL